jgi:hypothetical protein
MERPRYILNIKSIRAEGLVEMDVYSFLKMAVRISVTEVKTITATGQCSTTE